MTRNSKALTANPQGSIWHRWDPHIHMPGTLKSDNFRGEDQIAEYARRINACDPPIRARRAAPSRANFPQHWAVVCNQSRKRFAFKRALAYLSRRPWSYRKNKWISAGTQIWFWWRRIWMH